MTMADIEVVLEAASAASNHKKFVIAGSLSVLGAVIVPPADMVMSRDLDMYPILDPGRGFVEIAAYLGENSQFHKENGFYADPITPQLLSLPEGWESRLTQIPMGRHAIAVFLDINDVAIGKLVRGHENDLRWVKAGLAASILSLDTILSRAITVSSLSVEDRESLAKSVAWMSRDEDVDNSTSDFEENK